MNDIEGANSEEDSMVLLQMGIVNRIIKKHFPDKVVTADFKKEFNKALSLFVLYLQNTVTKKKYGRTEIINALEQEGLGRVAEDLRNNKQVLEVQKEKVAVQIEQP